MQRLFDDHIVRKVQSLDGIWNFAADPENCGEAEKWFLGLPKAQPMPVPSVWNTQLGLLTYEGAAWYERNFHADGGCLRFCFEAVMTAADVWLDGIHLGSHYGGFCQFDLIAEDVAPGMHRLTVRADNRFDENSIPHAKTDWYHYGGIPRSVCVEQLTGVCVLHNRFDYTLSSDMTAAECAFTLELMNASANETTSPLSVSLDGKEVYASVITLPGHARKTIVTPAFMLSEVRLWSPENPNLYDILCKTISDDLIDRTGLRKVEVRDQKVCLNGKPVELRGVNRHEEHPDWGFAFPVGLMQRDLDIASNMGCNTLRGSHYPNSQVFVDMLDSQGFLFWSEIPIWGHGFTEQDLANPAIVARGLEMHKEMVRCYCNHPSIILWGMHNEIESATQPALEMTKTYYAYLKENGGNRLVTYATDKSLNDVCLALCDIISINHYDGWYGGSRSSWSDFLESFRQRRHALGLDDKPVIISEFGAAAIYGHHTFDDLKWTEEYQADLLTRCLHLFHNDPMVVGFYIWQFCDIRTCEEMGLNRARSYNNKGILNEYRKPKAAYYAVQKAYQTFADEESET